MVDTALQTISVDGFKLQTGIHSSPFVVNLFVEKDFDLVVNVQLNINHRQVSMAQVAKMIHKPTGKLPVETLMADASSNSLYLTYQARPFQVFPYAIDSTQNKNDALPRSRVSPRSTIETTKADSILRFLYVLTIRLFVRSPAGYGSTGFYSIDPSI